MVDFSDDVNQSEQRSKRLYAKSREERQEWVSMLRRGDITCLCSVVDDHLLSLCLCHFLLVVAYRLQM